MKFKKLLLAVGLGLSTLSITACDDNPVEKEPTKEVVKEKVTVTLNYGYDVSNTTTEIEKDSNYTPTSPTRDGYDFVGWYTDDKLTNLFASGTKVDANITLYAKWTEVTSTVETVTVVLYYNDNLYGSRTDVYKKGIEYHVSNPFREGYLFGGWFTNKELTEPFENGIVLNSNLTLYAKWNQAKEQVAYGFGEGLEAWTKLEELVGTKEYDNNGKSYNVLKSEAKYNDITFASNGKNRINRDTEGNVTGYNTQQATITIKVNSKATIVVEGKWGSTSKSGKVYLKNGDNAVYTSNTYQANSGETIADVSFTKEVEAGTYTLTSDATINISKLLVSREIEYIDVIFESEHGTVPSAITLEKGDKLSALDDLSADGYVFEGWYTTHTFERKFDINTAIYAHTRLYAKWKVYDANNYATVSFDTDLANSSINPITLEKGNKVSSLPNLSVEGYRFAGWYTADNTLFTTSTVVNETITLHAKFIQQRTVTFKYEDNTVILTLTVDDESELKNLNVPTPKYNYGYSFNGWYNGTTLIDVNTTTVTTNLVLVAKYVASQASNNVSFMSAASYEEGLYAEFLKYDVATDYNCYVKKSTDSTYTKLDKQLTRLYKSDDNTYQYYRVDAVGLKEGSYTLKVVPVIENQEVTAAANETASLNVSKHDRSGFGFVNGTSSGAYNDDGTLKSNVRVIYVTNETKDTVETTAIVSKQTVTISGVQNIITAMKAQKGISDPVCIRFIGNIEDPANMPNGDLYLDDVKNLTVEGIGTDATMNGFGIVIKNSSNVEIRNLGFMNCNSKEGDDCGLQQDNNHVWVHNCDFFYGDAGSDADQAKGDGALDTKKSSYVTHSYNHFYDCGKCSLQGMTSEQTTNYITYHHNWYDHSDSRHPRVRTCTVHIYNNYFDGNAKYGIGSALGASIFAENNYFRSTTNTIPFMSGKMAHDIKDDGGNVLSGEAGGVIKEYGNVFDGNNFRYTKYQDNNSSFDAYQASSRDEQVPSTVVPASGTVYNNFDTNSSIMYQYTVQTAEEAKATVIAHAGRVQGGDFKWTFTDADDADYNVNTKLKAALKAYSSKLVSVLGVSGSSQGGDTPVVDGADSVIALIEALPAATAVTANDRTAINSAKSAYDALDATEQAKVTNKDKLDACIAALAALPQAGQVLTFNTGKTGDNSFFTVSANLKSGAAEKVYEGVTYTTAIKMESATSITFTTTASMTLVIVTDATAEKKIKIDDVANKTNTSGILIVELAAGNHTITKGDSINVYAVILK